MILDNARTTRTEQYLVPLPANRVIRLTMRCNRPLPVCRFEKAVAIYHYRAFVQSLFGQRRLSAVVKTQREIGGKYLLRFLRA